MNTKDLLIEELQQFTEGYKDIDALSLIADDIINLTAAVSTSNISQMFVEKKLTSKNIYFFNNMFLSYFIYEINQTEDKNVLRKKYGELFEFITVSECRISLYYSRSSYYRPVLNKITINTGTKKFVDTLYSYDIFNKEYSKDEQEQILKHAFDVGIKRAIIHELQHAYDEYRTEGKADTDKKSKDYFQKLSQYTNPKDMFGNETLFRQYLNLQGELWARFTDTLYKVPEYKYEDFDDWLWHFKTEFKGYDILSPKNKKRLYNALYKREKNKRPS